MAMRTALVSWTILLVASFAFGAPLPEAVPLLQMPAGAENPALYVEDPINPLGRRFAGWVTWRVETSAQEGGDSAARTLRGDIRIPGHATLTAEQNPGAGATASYRFEMTFASTESPNERVISVLGILMKLGEQAIGVPIAARTVNTRPNNFVVDLFSDFEGPRQQNLKLLREQTWLDIPIVYEDGRRALVTLAKGASGIRAFNEALAGWED
jgi:hypothetical protein